jgi:type IV pilus assembly protein PilN
MPEGVFLRSIKQTGPKINLVGYAQSNARVSTLMRNLDASPFLEQPALVEIKSGSLNNRRVSDFGLNIAITRAKTEDRKAPPPSAQTGPGTSSQPAPAQGGKQT